MLSPSAVDVRGPLGPEPTGFRRSLGFDLTNPVPGSGASTLGVARDHEAYIWIWFRRDPQTERVITFRELTVSDSIHTVERIEMHFRVDGVLHILQMGPFVEGQGGGAAWYTGMHGEGTSLGTVQHSSPNDWTVRASADSKARLWRFDDRAQPVDQGLYYFGLDMRFTSAPESPAGGCLPRPSTCRPDQHN
jgi:hypothetical protein